MGEESATEWPDDSDPFGEPPSSEDKGEQQPTVDEEQSIDTDPQSFSEETPILPVEE